MLPENILKNLRKSGWKEGRAISRETIKRKLEIEGYFPFEKVVDFLSEFAGLLIRFENQKSGGSDDIDLGFEKAMEIVVVERIWDYEKRVVKKLCIIGTTRDEYLILLMSEDGSVYGCYEDFLCFISDSGISALEALMKSSAVTPIP